MYNTLVRAQNTFGLLTTVVFFVATFIALSDLVVPRSPSSFIKATNVQV
jgi:hypothetical protein